MLPFHIYERDVAISRALLFLLFAVLFVGITPIFLLIVYERYQILQRQSKQAFEEVTLIKHDNRGIFEFYPIKSVDG